MLRRFRICYVLLAINVAVFLLQGAAGTRLLLAGAKVNSLITAGELHRLVTPMFLHASISHLAVNSFSLYSTGPAVESWFGRGRFASLYVVSGICGNVLSYLCTPTPSVGASGAIFGLVGATAVVLARHRRMLGPRARKALNSLAYIVLVNFGMSLSPGSRVDNFGHLGGLLGGIAYAYLAGPRLMPAKLTNGKTILIDRSVLQDAWDDAKQFFGKSGGGGRRRRR
jgi:membrane associated rhomboid family serine protease